MNPVCLGLEVVLLGARLCFGEPQIRTATIPVCPVTSPRDRDFQRRLAAELRAAVPGSAAEMALSEWLSLRDQARACRVLRR
ncbi:MAG TPA: hypothetical protein VHD34_09600 [Xanthobacteraceae bacterium]|nr:hypothetical protein [Xanthobacteraceae bacterium]